MNNSFTKEMALDSWNVVTADVDEFHDAVSALTGASEWTAGVLSKNLIIEPIDGPIIAGEIAAKCKCDYEIAYDTCENSHLTINTGYTSHCLRNTAMSSLFETGKIQGSALGRLSPVSLSEVLNRCLQVAKGSSLILNQAGKVSALMSDNSGGYRIMPQTELVDIALEKMIRRFGKVDFKQGTVEHGFTFFIAELPDAQKKLNDSYNEVIGNTGRKVELMPAVAFSTSDTGRSAASLRPVFRPVGASYYYPVNNGLKVDHIRGKGSAPDGVEKFSIEADLLHSKFDETAETIDKMTKVTFQNPLNAYIAISRKIGIPQKYAKEGYEDLEHYCMGDPCTVHDLYLSMSRCISAAAAAKASKTVIMALTDAVARVLTLHWTDFDLPGVVAWSKAA